MPSSKSSDPASIRILVVDDNDDHAAMFAHILRDLGHQTRFVTDPFETFAQLRDFKPDLVFLDIAMPGLDGYEIARTLRAKYGPDGIRIVAVTAYGDKEARTKVREAGFDAHVLKPVDFEIIESIVATIKR
jgi:CheY-like chemotaxis protein